MRTVPLALLALISAPAMAGPQVATPSAEQAARALQEPLAQEVAAGVIDQLVGIVLDTRVGSLAAMTGPGGDIHPNDTLRDVKRRDDPGFERRLRQDTRRAVKTTAAVAGGAMAQAAELRRTADRLEAAIGPLIAAMAGSRKGY